MGLPVASVKTPSFVTGDPFPPRLLRRCLPILSIVWIGRSDPPRVVSPQRLSPQRLNPETPSRGRPPSLEHSFLQPASRFGHPQSPPVCRSDAIRRRSGP